ncbi:hypothetical protein SEA_MABODAMACA_71 [Microbacterium phage Mabodamaca]|uniref:Uncharacterized protein n=1 Tax=Microbacterium phage Mabodamaca TaxID=3078574 RepID=A0AA96SDV0_9CAUD|nr:hypothetical protein SEA_MABODAMACA_71 [Microbacterium phage Mabodamaca]
MSTANRPTGPGQAVLTDGGVLGITTDIIPTKGPNVHRIGVMLVGWPYSIRMDVEELTRVELPALA